MGKGVGLERQEAITVSKYRKPFHIGVSMHSLGGKITISAVHCMVVSPQNS